MTLLFNKVDTMTIVYLMIFQQKLLFYERRLYRSFWCSMTVFHIILDFISDAEAVELGHFDVYSNFWKLKYIFLFLSPESCAR